MIKLNQQRQRVGRSGRRSRSPFIDSSHPLSLLRVRAAFGCVSPPHTHPTRPPLFSSLASSQARVLDRRAAVRDTEEGSDDDEGGESGKGRKSGGAAKVLDQWQHCASVLCNAARIPEGRCGATLCGAVRPFAVRCLSRWYVSRGWCALVLRGDEGLVVGAVFSSFCPLLPPRFALVWFCLRSGLMSCLGVLLIFHEIRFFHLVCPFSGGKLLVFREVRG